MPAASEETVLAPDDMTGPYLAQRQELEQMTAANDLLARVRSRKPQKAADDVDEAADETAPKPGSVAGRVARDIGTGTLEAPRAVASGAISAVQATLDFAEEIDDWVQTKVPLGGFQVRNEKGDFDFRYLKPDEWKQLGAEDKGFDLPAPASPRSTTGRLIKGISQFVVGMAGAGKVKGLQALKGTGTAGKLSGYAIQGAIADFFAFQPHEERLSNLVETFPALQNPVTEYLAADPEDGAAEGRFKNALEGLSLGIMSDGFISSVRALRNMRTAKAAVELVEPKIADDAFKALGDPDLPAITSRTDIDKKLMTATEATADGFKDVPGDGVFINWARIDAPEDVQEAMARMADSHKVDIDAARRGVQSFDEIELNADQVNAWQTLMERRTGQPLNAEQSVAARRLWVSSADKLTQVSKEASTNPSEANLFAFRKMLATHYAIQKEVIGARTETARALASWRIPAGGSTERMRDLQFVLEAQGGMDASRELAQRVAALSGSGMARELDQVVERTVYAKTRDAVIEGWIMGLLSGPKTHAVNMMSNTSVVAMQMYERGTAAQLAKFLGDDGSVALGEAGAQFFGMLSGLKDGLRNAAKSWRTGQSGYGIGKIDIPQQGAISSEALGLSASGWLGRSVDGIGNLVRIPGRALQAEDEFFKTIGYRMEVNAQALRMARDEVMSGKLHPDDFKIRIADLVESPPENIRLAAVDQALYQTFTNAPGKFAKGILKIRNNHPAIGTLLLPFARTPANIMRFTFERTPLAPLMKAVRADLAAGGARRDLALARMGTGTAIMLAAADNAMNGQISGGGPVDPSARAALLRSGWQPYSVKFGDKWFAFSRLDPLGMLFGISGDMVEILSNTDMTGAEDMEKVIVAAAASVGSNVMSKTYLSGLAEFFEAMADPTRYSETYAQRLAASFVPATSLSGEIRRMQDPYMREVRSMLDAMRNKIPTLSEGLPPRRDLWGRPISYQSPFGALYDAFSPIYAKQENPEPIDQELLSGGEFSRAASERRDMNAEVEPFTVSAPDRKVSFDGAIVNLDNYPGAYSRYLELAGNELKHPAWDMGAKDLLNAIVSGKHPLSEVYQIRSDGPDGGKEVFIRDTISDFRERARTQLLEEYPGLRRDVEAKKTKRRELRMPVMGSAR